MRDKLVVTFNGVNLTDILTITDVDRGIRLGKSFDYQDKINQIGVNLAGFTSQLVSFPMDFSVIYDLNSKKDQLKALLNVKEPKPLTFSDEPGRIYYAIPRSDISIEEIFNLGKGMITWEIPDGVAYSEQDYIFTNKSLVGVSLDSIEINNPGSEPIELELLAQFNSDNGFIGLESDDGKVRALFGEMEEVDGFNYQVSESLFDDHLNVDRGWTLNNGVIPPVTSGMAQQGSVSYVQESPGEGYVKALLHGTANNSWSGPSLTKMIPPDSTGAYPENWTAAFRTDFNTDGGGKNRTKQVGHQSITFSDQTGKIIVSVVIEDNTASAQKSDLAIYIRNKRVYDSRNTTSYYVTARPADKNHVKVEKVGNKITVELAFIGKKLSFDFNESNIELRKITFYNARYKNFLPIQNNLLRALNVVKHNVIKYKDIPNKFMNGDRLTYGKSRRNVFCRLNEMNALGIRDVGSNLITAAPGRSFIYLAYSSFSETPEITLRGRAKYII